MSSSKDSKSKSSQNSTKKNGAEKPVSLWGPSFEEVLGALLKSKPMPKEKKKKQKNVKGSA